MLILPLMFTVSEEKIRQTIAILGADNVTEDELETRVAALAQDKFQVKASDGNWIDFEFKAEHQRLGAPESDFRPAY